jgi:hypothetical protein
MNIPRELIIYILKIKSQQAWTKQKSKIHTLLRSVLSCEQTIIHWQRQTIVYMYMHRIMEIVVEESPRSIYIMRAAGKSFPTEYILRS